MIAVSNECGLTLVFKDVEDLRLVIAHLSGQLEWVEANDVPPPYIYTRYHSDIGKDEIDKYTDKLKVTFAQGSPG